MVVPHLVTIGGQLIVEVYFPRTGWTTYGHIGTIKLTVLNALRPSDGQPWGPQTLVNQDMVFQSYQPTVDGQTLDLARAQNNLVWNAGYGAVEGRREIDSLQVVFETATTYEGQIIAALTSNTPVVISDLPGTITGLLALPVGNSGTWNVITDWNVTGYRYQWYVDEVLSPGDTWWTMTRTFNSKGVRSLRAAQILVDGTILNSYFSVSVHPDVNIVGPAEVNPAQNYTWSVSTNGATPPYSYQWYLDNSPVGTSSTFTTMFSPSAQHDIAVDLTDVDGWTVSASLTVNSNTGTGPYCPPNDPSCSPCDPQVDPSCGELMRAPPKTSPAAPKPKRPIPAERGGLRRTP